MLQQCLRYGDADIIYNITFIEGNQRRIAIHVYSDCSVQVNAPCGTAPENIKQAVQKRARWLQNQLSKTKRQYKDVLPREYVSGESHLYLGRRYVLKVLNSDSSVDEIRCWRGRLEAIVSKRDSEQVKHCLQRWYRQRADVVFKRRLRELCQHLPWVKQLPPIRLRRMRKQWGSCSPDGSLLLNPHLVKAPVRCIDYVLMHELCHLRHHNHNQEFYQLMQKHNPNWKYAKRHLDGMAEVLLNE